MFIFFTLLLFFPFVFLDDEIFERFYVKNADQRHALCNDGSGSIYYIHKNMDSKTWFIHLNGGGGCSTIETCNQRWQNSPDLMSSSNQKENITKNIGIFSSDCEKNPSFCNVNKVFVHYCSSDRHSGNNDKSSTTGGWYFHGANIVNTIFEDLIEDHGLRNAKTVVLSGDSAGGEGVWNRGDYIGDYLEKEIGKNVDFRILSGSAFFLDGKTFSPSALGFEETVKLGSSKDFWNFIPDEDCGKYFQDKPWLCLVGHLVYPFVRNNKMAIMFIYDSVQASYDGVYKSRIQDLTKSERNWVNKRGDFVQSKINELIKETGNAVYALGCYNHDIIPQTRFLDYKTLDGKTPALAVSEWMNNNTIIPVYVDNCKDVDCNHECY